MATESPHREWSWTIDATLEDASTVVASIVSCGPLDAEHVRRSPAAAFCTNALRSDSVAVDQKPAPIKLLLPASSGFVLQSDFLQRRMVDCPGVAGVESFVACCGQQVRGHDADAYRSMPPADLLQHCYGALALDREPGPDATSTTAPPSDLDLHDELGSRLSFPWLSTTPVPQRRLAFVGAAPLCKFRGYAVAAASLGIALVVMDVPRDEGDELDQYRRLCDTYVPFDMTADETLVRRLVDAVTDMQNRDSVRFDGIMSVDEHLLGIVAQAAVVLGLPTSAPSAVALAQDKFRTRQLEAGGSSSTSSASTSGSESPSSSSSSLSSSPSSSSYSRLVTSPAELQALLAEETPRPYPLIVKPCKGWSSEGVWRVTDDTQLEAKISALWERLFADWHGRHVVVEPYVDGPEVDANMVLVDGRIVFFEVNDDFPSSADVAATADENKTDHVSPPPATFVETCNMLPSALPPHELDLLRQRLHETALAVGFRDGVLHMEARIRNSTCHFTTDPDSEVPVVDLHTKSPSSPPPPPSPDDIFLIEINPRPPGWQEVEATARAYGVSYYALALLAAAGDRTRLAALARPFARGAQYHMQLLFVSARRGGVFRWPRVSETVMARLDRRNKSAVDANAAAAAAAHVVLAVDLMQPGQEVPDPRSGKVFGSFIAFFLVVSRRSRRDALTLGREIENEVRVVTEEF